MRETCGAYALQRKKKKELGCGPDKRRSEYLQVSAGFCVQSNEPSVSFKLRYFSTPRGTIIFLRTLLYGVT